jgi:NhaP-type Na+/H+ or K+/H+ antiporter
MEATAAQGLALSIGIGALGSAVADKWRIPALPLLIALGLGLGVSGFGWIDTTDLGDLLSVIVALAIGLLVFEGSCHLTIGELRHAPRAVIGLLTVGAATTWAGTMLLAWALGMHPLAATLLGACIIVTGPTVIQPLLRRVRLTPPLHTALAAEAVFIDPIGVLATVVTLDLAKGYVATGQYVPRTQDFWDLVLLPVAGGIVLGILTGLAGLFLVRYLLPGQRAEPKRLNLFAIGLCMASYGIGETVAGGGGLIATTLTAAIFGHARVAGVGQMRDFNEQLSTILVGMLFVLLASRFEVSRLAGLQPVDGLIVLGVLFAVRPACILLSTLGSTLSRRERAMACLIAPRGVVALSVISISAIELATFATTSLKPGGDAHIARFLTDVPRVELIIFTLIVSSVLWTAVTLPLASSRLKVRLRAPNGVALVGIHPLAIQFALALRDRGITVLLADSSPTKVDSARALGLTALPIDVTDTRRLDDDIDRSRVGYLIAWTGNSDVDRVAARWAIDRLGENQVRLWPSRTVPPDLAQATLSLPQPLTPTSDQWLIRFGALASHEGIAVPLGGLTDGRFTFATPTTGQFHILHRTAAPAPPPAALA